MCSILSQLAREDRVAVIDGFSVDAPKTKLLAAKLKAMGDGSVLLITDTFDENLHLASRNLRNVMIVEPRHADPVSLVRYDKVLITRAALAQVQEMLA
jgi:large subunit ribosomal protein L4